MPISFLCFAGMVYSVRETGNCEKLIGLVTDTDTVGGDHQKMVIYDTRMGKVQVRQVKLGVLVMYSTECEEGITVICPVRSVQVNRAADCLDVLYQAP